MTAIKNIGKHKLRALMKKHYANMTNRALAKKCGVSEDTIRAVNRTLNLKKSPEHRAGVMRALHALHGVWSPEMVEILALMYPVMHNDDLGELLGVTPKAAYLKAQALKLRKQRKTPEEKEAIAKEKKALREKRGRERQKAAREVVAKPKPQKPPKAAKMPKRKPAPIARSTTPPKPPPAPKLPPPMTPAMLARMERERFSYAKDALPFRAMTMFGTSLTGYDLSYRGQATR